MSPRTPFQGLQEQALPPAHIARHATPDLFCHETMPTPAELDALVAASATAKPTSSRPDDCFCLDDCPGPRCHFANPGRKRKALRTPSPTTRARQLRGYRSGDDAWPQRVLIWHPGDFEASPQTVEADEPFRSLFHDFCYHLRIDPKHVRFVWQQSAPTGEERPVTLHDYDAPFHVGMREGRTEHIECEYK
jgi:hypothetical protein